MDEKTEQARRIAARASRVSATARDAIIKEACGADASLRAAVHELLRRDEAATLAVGADPHEAATVAPAQDDDAGHPTRPASTTLSETALLSDLTIGEAGVSSGSAVFAGRGDRTDAHGGADWSPNSGVTIGAYRVIGRLGAGAMGVVYLAEQSNPKRNVALKVVRPDFLTRAAMRRFEFEASTLGRLKHPGIASIYEAGTAGLAGVPTPFFAMELVSGEPLDAYAERLDRMGKLRLMIAVAEAVEHAHQRGVIHRDLKPANILVEDSGAPKVLDFGVARAIDEAAEHPSELAGTAPYMSPEQLSASPDLDTRSDVYALGVILYELLTKRRPFDLSGLTIEEAREVVLAAPPAAPSTVEGSEADRDLDFVTLKCLACEPGDRYPTAGDLADELRRRLRDEPVEARPRTPAYVAARFVRRNTGLVAASAAAALILVAGVFGVAAFAVEAERGRRLAQTEAARAEAVNRFLTDMLASVDPENALGAEVLVRDVLDEAAATADVRLGDRPAVESAVRVTMAHTYRGLGLVDRAVENARRAVERAKKAFGRNDPRTADALSALGVALIEAGEPAAAQETLAAVVDIRERTHGVGSAEAALARGELARAYLDSGRRREALRIWESSLETTRRELGERDARTLTVMHNYASALSAMGRFDEADRFFNRVIELRRDVFGPEHPQTLTARSMLASMLQRQDRNAEAAEQFRAILAGRRDVLGPRHHSTITAGANLGVALIRLAELARLEGREARAAEALREAGALTHDAVEGYGDLLGADHQKTITTLGNLAYILEELGEDARAEALYREVIEERLTDEARMTETWGPRNNLAMLLQRGGRVGEAAAIYQRLLPADHYLTAIFRNNYGDCLADLGRSAEAREQLEASHAVLLATFGEGHPRVTKSAIRLSRTEASRDANATGGDERGEANAG